MTHTINGVSYNFPDGGISLLDLRLLMISLHLQTQVCSNLLRFTTDWED